MCIFSHVYQSVDTIATTCTCGEKIISVECLLGLNAATETVFSMFYQFQANMKRSEYYQHVEK